MAIMKIKVKIILMLHDSLLKILQSTYAGRMKALPLYNRNQQHTNSFEMQSLHLSLRLQAVLKGKGWHSWVSSSTAYFRVDS